MIPRERESERERGLVCEDETEYVADEGKLLIPSKQASVCVFVCVVVRG